MNEVHHLAGGDVVDLRARLPRQLFGEVPMERSHLPAEEHVSIRIHGTVCVQLDEDPVIASGDVNPLIEPESQSRGCWWIRSGQVGVFEPGKQPPFAPSPVQRQRPLNEEQIIGARALGIRFTDGSVDERIERSTSTAFVSVAEGVDAARLRVTRRGGIREICVTAEIAKRADLGGHAAPAAIRAGIAERPITMHEAKTRSSRSVTGQVAVAREVSDAFFDLAAKCGLRVAIVMKLHLDLRSRFSTDLTDDLDVGGIELLDGIEEAVARAASVTVSEARSERGICRSPVSQPFACPGIIGAMQRLEVIANGEKDMPCRQWLQLRLTTKGRD